MLHTLVEISVVATNSAIGFSTGVDSSMVTARFLAAVGYRIGVILGFITAYGCMGESIIL